MKIRFEVFWGVVLIVSVLFMRLMPGIDVKFAKDTFLLGAGFLSLCVFGIFRARKKYPIEYLAMGVIPWTFYVQFHNASAAVYTSWVMVCVWVVLFFQFKSHFDTSKPHEVFEKTFIYMAWVACAWAILNRGLGKEPMELLGYEIKFVAAGAYRGMIVGPLGNKQLSVNLITFAIPFAIFYRNWWALAVLLLTTYLHDSAMAWVSLLGAGCIWVFCQYKDTGKWLAVPPLLATGVVVSFWAMENIPFFTPGNRIEAWETFFTKFPTPWQGWGLGFVFTKLGAIVINGERFLQLHNEPLELFASMGVYGILIMIVAVTTIWHCNKKDPWFYGLVILCINSLCNLTFHLGILSLMALMCYARILSNKEYDESIRRIS